MDQQAQPNGREPVLFDVGDAASVKEVIKESKSNALRRKEAVLSFMSTVDGRAWFHDLLVKCHCYANPFSTDAGRMAFACGEMNIGQQVLSEIESASPELYLLMMKEARDGRSGSSGGN